MISREHSSHVSAERNIDPLQPGRKTRTCIAIVALSVSLGMAVHSCTEHSHEPTEPQPTTNEEPEIQSELSNSLMLDIPTAQPATPTAVKPDKLAAKSLVEPESVSWCDRSVADLGDYFDDGIVYWPHGVDPASRCLTDIGVVAVPEHSASQEYQPVLDFRFASFVFTGDNGLEIAVDISGVPLGSDIEDMSQSVDGYAFNSDPQACKELMDTALAVAEDQINSTQLFATTEIPVTIHTGLLTTGCPLLNQ